MWAKMKLDAGVDTCGLETRDRMKNGRSLGTTVTLNGMDYTHLEYDLFTHSVEVAPQVGKIPQDVGLQLR